MQLLPTSVSCKLAFLSIWWEHITHYKQCSLYKHLADILKSEVLLSHPQNCNNSSPKRIVKHSCYCQSQTWYSTLLLLKLFTLELHQPLIRYKISAKLIRLMWKTFKAPFLYHPIETWPLHLSWKVANASLLWWTWSFFSAWGPGEPFAIILLWIGLKVLVDCCWWMIQMRALQTHS